MQTETIRLTGLNSDLPGQTIADALSAVAGVLSVNASLPDNQVEVRFNEKITEISQILSALTDAGFKLAELNQTKSERGRCCGGCCA